MALGRAQVPSRHWGSRTISRWLPYYGKANVCVHVCLCVCLCAYMCVGKVCEFMCADQVCEYTLCLFVCLCICLHVCIDLVYFLSVCLSVCLRVCACLHMCACICVSVLVLVCVEMCTFHICVSVLVCLYVSACVCVYVCVVACGPGATSPPHSPLAWPAGVATASSWRPRGKSCPRGSSRVCRGSRWPRWTAQPSAASAANTRWVPRGAGGTAWPHPLSPC